MAELKAWKEQLTKAKKTAIIQGGVRKVHYEMPRDEQLSEDYDMKTGDLLVRKWKRCTAIGKESDWEYEVGLPPLKQDMQAAGGMWESKDTPKCYRQDCKTHFAWRIQNTPWPKSNFQITVDNNVIVVRTLNKKYFKKLQIADMERCGLSLETPQVTCAHANNTLLISYEKPAAIVLLEQEIYSELCKIKPMQDGDMDGCKQQ